MFHHPWFSIPQHAQGDKWRQNDRVDIRLGELNMIMSRRSKLDVPAEFAAFIPRAEIRRRYYSNGELVQEEEFILNSITITHAPRFPAQESRSPAQMSDKNAITGDSPVNKTNCQERRSKKIPVVSVSPPGECIPRLKFGGRER
ncbi:hypothetical protein [Desulfofundulus thermocisternus]|nr:hypothetical protein [Desulfofundulus thermocisternus]MCS5695967.1 hypothetical protein [Desulfofundulus thermocisternus]